MWFDIGVGDFGGHMARGQCTRLPEASEIVSVSGSPEPGGDHRGMLVVVAGGLYRLHRELWLAEDECRRDGLGDAEVARMRRRIEQLNLERSQLIDELDAWVAACISQDSEEGPLHTETLGSVVDRLCIARIRSEMFELKWSRSHSADLVGRREHAGRQLNELAMAYDQLVSEVVLGHRRLPDWRALKSYGGSVP